MLLVFSNSNTTKSSNQILSTAFLLPSVALVSRICSCFVDDYELRVSVFHIWLGSLVWVSQSQWLNKSTIVLCGGVLWAGWRSWAERGRHDICYDHTDLIARFEEWNGNKTHNRKLGYNFRLDIYLILFQKDKKLKYINE